MEAVAGITARIMQIQSQLAQLAPRPPVQVAQPLGGSPLSGGTASGTASTGSASATALAGGAATTTASAFAAALGQAVTAQAPATAGADVVGSGKGQLDAKGIPLELVPHGNGKVPADALSPIAGSDHRLWTPAARSFEALRAAAERDGVSIKITDSYRSFESQVDVARRKGLYNQGGLAAVPGTSKHGWGMALDLGLDAKAQSWMREHAGEYGFVEDVPREPWHWGYKPTH